MLWLSGLMGLMAVGMFTLLWFLPVRRTADDSAADEGEDTILALSLLTEPAEASPGAETDERAVTQDEHPQESDPPEDIDETDVAEPDLAAPEEAPAEDVAALVEDAEDAAMPSDEAVPDWFASLAASLADEDEDTDPEEDASTQSWDADAEPGDAADIVAEQTADATEEEMDEWFLAGAETEDFADFDPEEDDLVLIWDDAQGDVPSVEVVRNDDDPSIARVLMGDVILAQFRTRADIRCDAVSMVPLSTARTLGWAQL